MYEHVQRKARRSMPGDRKYGHVMKRDYQRSRCDPASVHFVTLELDYPQQRATVRISNENPDRPWVSERGNEKR